MRVSYLVLPALVLAAACADDSIVAPGALPSTPSTSAAAANGATLGYIITFDDSVTSPSAKARALAAQHGVAPRYVYEHALKGFAAPISDAAAQALSRVPGVRRVEADGIASINTTQTGATWGLDRIDQASRPLDASYTYNVNGAGVTAYILDTGIRYSHTEFWTSATDSTRRAVFGTDQITTGGTGADCNGHGTHVAGTVGGLKYGVAKATRLVAVRVLDCNGSGSWSAVIGGIDWVTANHAAGAPAVANMSLGGSYSQSVNDAVTRAITDGVVFAVAAGNSTADACSYSPASTPTAITLGASDASDTRASFSNYGACVDFFAPGVSITSASYASNTGTATYSGTSMASPHAAGAAALYLQAFPGSTPVQVRDGLFNLSTKSIITSSLSANNHLLYTLPIGSGGPPPNAPPTASFAVSCSLLACTFTDQSTDVDGTVAARSWSFGDSANSTTQSPSYTYAAGGTYTVTLTVTDDDGASASTSKTVTVSSSPPPPANIVLTAIKRTKGTFKVDLAWSGSSAPNVDVYRNGVRVTTVTNTGLYTDNIGKKTGTYSHKVCEAGTSTCSNTTTTTF